MQDLKTIPKHVLGMANSGGGSIIVGVTQNEDNSLDPVGIESIIDKSEITNTVGTYIPQALFKSLEILDFSYQDSDYAKLKGKKFQIVLILSEYKYAPFLASRETEGLRNTAIYVRRGSSTVEANYDELQVLLNKRIETQYSTTLERTLNDHFEQLKALYKEISPTRTIATNILGDVVRALNSLSGIWKTTETVENPKYPKEGFEDFIVRLIEGKKQLIRNILGLA